NKTDSIFERLNPQNRSLLTFEQKAPNPESEPVFSIENSNRIFREISFNQLEVLSLCLFLFWILGVSSLLVVFIRRFRSCHRIVSNAIHIESPFVTDLFEKWKGTFKLNRRIRIVSSSDYPNPLSKGIIRPVIYIPQSLISRKNSRILDSIIAHEMVHIKNFDQIWLAIQNFCQIVFFFHPVVWNSFKRIQHYRECLCDTLVLSTGKISVQSYGHGLLAILNLGHYFSKRLVVAAALEENFSGIKKRINNIKKGGNMNTRNIINTISIISLLGILLLPLSGSIFQVDDSGLFSPKLIKNSKTPLNKNAGRILKLKEELRIDDIGDEFYFKNPQDIKASPNGSIFIIDENQLLHFDSSGKFIRNYFKSGQGPGGFMQIRGYLVDNDKLIIQDAGSKIMNYDFSGRLISEHRHHEIPVQSSLRLGFENTYYFSSRDWPMIDKPSALTLSKNKMISFSPDNDKISSLMDFPTKVYIAQSQKSKMRGMVNVEQFIAVPFQQKFLFLSHTGDYLIKLYDVEKNKVLRMFTRKFPKIRITEEYELEKTSGLHIDGKPVKVREMKFQDGVRCLFINGGNIWVMTSIKDKNKGTLFDVFTPEGEYIDNFYLKIPENQRRRIYGKWHFEIKDGSLYTIERTPESTYCLKRYRIIDEDLR
ncbi:M56 family metallopeptidase, partial [Acidobacteriota bacterium]